jgi:hypothetical protein
VTPDIVAGSRTLPPAAQLGATGLEISRVGVGAWAIGAADYDGGWGA